MTQGRYLLGNNTMIIIAWFFSLLNWFSINTFITKSTHCHFFTAFFCKKAMSISKM